MISYTMPAKNTSAKISWGPVPSLSEYSGVRALRRRAWRQIKINSKPSNPPKTAPEKESRLIKFLKPEKNNIKGAPTVSKKLKALGNLKSKIKEFLILSPAVKNEVITAKNPIKAACLISVGPK